MTHLKKRNALILLVVLGMLSLFSLLAVTYVVFAGQARTASLAMVKRDARGTPPEQMMDQVVRQVIRGTRDESSALYRHGMLEDLYGAVESPFTVKARETTDKADRSTRPTPGYTPSASSISSGDNHGPQLYGGHLLKIPLEYSTEFPEQHDAWTGRVLTFLEGPLQGQSVRIVRYIGEIDFDATNVAAYTNLLPVQYSILVDLSDIKEQSTTLNNVTRSVAEWASQNTYGASLLYSNYTARLSGAYRMLVNAAEFNSHGTGIDIDGTSGNTTANVPRLVALGYTTTTLPAPYNSIPEAFLPNMSYLKQTQGVDYRGDTDERYDAADYNNFFMTLLYPSSTGTLDSDRINPAFHRQAIVNAVLGSSVNLASMSPEQFVSLLEVLHRACARPLSYRVQAFPNGGTGGGTTTLLSNPYFTGSNRIDNTNGARAPQLDLNWANRNNATEQNKFEAWLRWLTRGPWDVDNDGDGLADSVWVDINMPLMTSSEGKLLKVLAAFYITDMDSKLDLNAAGSQAQGALSTFTQYLPANDPRYAYNGNWPSQSFWPQGLGFGSADISLAQLFDGANDYTNMLNRRYRGSGELVPGATGNETISSLLERGRAATHSNRYFPALPKSVHGRMGLGLDLLGNPILVDANLLSQNSDDPYDTRVLSSSRSDTPISIAEWERISRYGEWDRSTLPVGLEDAAGTSLKPGASNPAYFSRARSISPRNVSLNLPGFAGEYQQTRTTTTTPSVVTRRVASFIEFVEAYAQRRFTPGTFPYFPSTAMEQLFPIEFHQNRAMNINRPFGDGYDNDNDGLIDERDELQGHGINNDTANPAIDDANEVTTLSAMHQPARYTAGTENYVEDYTLGTVRFDNSHSTTSVPTALSADEYSMFNGEQPKQLYARHLYCLAQLILPDSYVFPGETAAPSVAVRARRLAQWAVNVVDFRDADATMTRFAYDATPFVAQNVGGRPVYWNPTSADPDVPHDSTAATDAQDGVVYGVEAPELLITESLATHDIRIRENPSPPPGTNRFQQIRIPQGSLFLEFYCPRSTTPGTNDDTKLPGVPTSLYDTSTTATQPIALDLGRLTPAQTRDQTGALVNRTRYPVWRVLLTTPDYNATEPPYELYRDHTKRSEYSFQAKAEKSGLYWRHNTKGSDPAIDRVLWFTNLAPTAANVALPGVANAEKKVFGLRNTATGLQSAKVQGGQYLVVGPRPVTYFGSKKQTGAPVHKPNNHRIALADNTATRPNWVQTWFQTNDPGLWLEPNNNPPGPRAAADPTPNLGKYVRQCVTMIAGADAPAGWIDNNPWNTSMTTYPPFIGLNISEPTPDSYYTKPTQKLNTTDTAAVSDTDTGVAGFNLLPEDAYVDLGTGGSSAPEPFDSDGTMGFLSRCNWPAEGGTDVRPHVGSKEHWSTALLQRLADPQLPWHEVLNPYITVDMMSIDLVVFSGEHTIAPDIANFRFASRQKTGATFRKSQDAVVLPQGNTNVAKTFYSYHSERAPVNSTTYSATGKEPYFEYELAMEVRGQTPAGSEPFYPALTRNSDYFCTLGYLNSRFEVRGYPSYTAPPTEYTDTNTNWLLRKYMGAPKVTPLAPYHPNREFVSNLELTSVPMSGPGTLMQEFTTDFANGSNATSSFGHTFDFEEAGDPSASTWLNRPKAAAILLQLLNVESPWLDAWKIANPDVTKFDSSGTTQAITLKNAILTTLRAPYNMIPTYREPGRINLNTVTEQNVLRGLMYNAITPTGTQTRGNAPIPYASEIESARQGYTTPASALTVQPNPRLNSSYPSEFVGVFGSSQTIDKFPNASLVPLKANSSSENSLLRHKIDVTAGTRNERLFAASSSAPNNTFMQYYPASRLANLTTDRSNVFAIRVVLGYFEFDSATGIGVEYGAEYGRSRRHRAFYMVDRSIPVGFSSGRDFNTDNVILLRRIIE